MSKLKDHLRTKGVVNSFEFYGEQPHIAWMARSSAILGRWQVFHGVYSTDPQAAWYDYGRKSFCESSKSVALDQAKSWAGQRYGITSWKRDPFGSYGSANYIASRLKGLK